MKSAVFSTTNESYHISNIAFAGPISSIPEEKRKGECTHSFRMVTSQGTVYCRYRSEETAKNARGALGAMMSHIKGHLFRSGYVSIDPSKVVSFGSVVSFKNRVNDKTHGFTVQLSSIHEKSAKVWLSYDSEEQAQTARKGLYASICRSSGISKEESNSVSQVSPGMAVAAAQSL